MAVIASIKNAASVRLQRLIENIGRSEDYPHGRTKNLLKDRKTAKSQSAFEKEQRDWEQRNF